MTAITPASGHPPVIASGADVAAGVSEHTWRAYQSYHAFITDRDGDTMELGSVDISLQWP